MLASLTPSNPTLDATVEEQFPVDSNIDDAPFYVHVQFKVRRAVVANFRTMLARTIEETPGAEVLLSGALSDDSHVHLTAAISMGPESLIPDFSAQSLAGYAMCEAFFNTMLDFAPKYVPVPNEAEAAGAVAVADGLNMTAITSRAA